MLSVNDPTTLTGTELAHAIASGVISSSEAVDAFLARISSLDEKLHAFVAVYADDARSAAQAADKAIRAGCAVGPFHGVPIALKDLVELEGKITTGGSAHWRQRRSAMTATLAHRLAANGMIVLGKTHTVEFAFGGWGTNEHMGTPWNPWDPEVARTPGGSSSGSGVAVAARMTPWAIGTDTGGSVRLPASYCGITALKTTVGRISTHGVLPLSETLDTVGPMARTVADAALLFSLLQGEDPQDSKTRGIASTDVTTLLKSGVAGLKLARMPNAERDGVDPDVLSAYDASLQVLAELGADIVDVELPFCFVDCFPAQTAIMQAEAYAFVGDLMENHDAMIGDVIRERILVGRDLSAQDYLSARRQQRTFGQAMRAAMKGVDALLTPTTETPAVALRDLDETRAPSRFTRFVNTLDLCALALPNGLAQGSLPTSLQIVCDAFEEAKALRIGYAFQRATSWHGMGPPIGGS